MDKMNPKRQWMNLALILTALFNSCTELYQKKVYDEDPLCKEMRKTCEEYSEYQKITDGKKSQRLNELRVGCYEYSKSCGQAIGQAGK
jgi:hypothetical protein